MRYGALIPPESVRNMDETAKAFLLKFFDIADTKDKLVQELDEIKDFYFSQLIINRIIEDGLNPIEGNDLFSIKVTVLNVCIL